MRGPLPSSKAIDVLTLIDDDPDLDGPANLLARYIRQGHRVGLAQREGLVGVLHRTLLVHDDALGKPIRLLICDSSVVAKGGKERKGACSTKRQ
jgi:hypothetical protein